MELCLPMQYTEITMEYYGSDGYRFYRNLTGLLAISPAVTRALSAYGFSTAKLSGAIKVGYALAYAKFGVAATVAAGIVGGALAVGAFAMLWNVRMFY